jgi:hypothetical protein
MSDRTELGGASAVYAGSSCHTAECSDALLLFRAYGLAVQLRRPPRGRPGCCPPVLGLESPQQLGI